MSQSKTILVDVFATIDEAIYKDLRIPAVIPTQIRMVSSYVECNVAKFNTVRLKDVLDPIKHQYMAMENELKELKKDLKTVLSNGSVRHFSDSYYSNYDGVKESIEIYNKYFKKDLCK